MTIRFIILKDYKNINIYYKIKFIYFNIKDIHILSIEI